MTKHNEDPKICPKCHIPGFRTTEQLGGLWLYGCNKCHSSWRGYSGQYWDSKGKLQNGLKSS